MSDYGKDISIEQKKAEDFIKRYDGITKNGVDDKTFDLITRAFREVNEGWDDKDVLVKLIDRIDHISRYTVTPYKVGHTFAELNDPDYCLIRDGFITIGAEANAGKSSFLTALSLEIMRHNKNMAFLFYSLDDCELLSGKRILSQITRVNQFRNTFNMDTISDQDRSEITDLMGRIMMKESFNLHTVERDAERTKKRCGCTRIIIGIDYLQIIPTTTENRREHYNDAVKGLKEVQKRMAADGCIMFLLSQFNRDRSSTTYRYRETSEIENQSDVCIDIKGDDANREDPSREITVMKNKLGKKGRIWKTSFRSAVGGTDFNFTPLTATTRITTTEDADTDDYKRRLR